MVPRFLRPQIDETFSASTYENRRMAFRIQIFTVPILNYFTDTELGMASKAAYLKVY